MGARIYDRTEMDTYDVDPLRVTVTTKAGMTVRAKWILFATGYEVVEILNPNPQLSRLTAHPCRVTPHGF